MFLYFVVGVLYSYYVVVIYCYFDGIRFDMDFGYELGIVKFWYCFGVGFIVDFY